MRSFQESLPELTQRNIRAVAVSVDPPATTRAHLAKTAWTYTFLCDPEAKAVGAYALRHDLGGGKVIARPAEFLIDPSGTVRWRDLTDDFRHRVRPKAVIKAFDRLKAAGG